MNKTGIMYYYPSVRKVMSQESVLSRAVATTDTMPCDRHHSFGVFIIRLFILEFTGEPIKFSAVGVGVYS